MTDKNEQAAKSQADVAPPGQRGVGVDRDMPDSSPARPPETGGPSGPEPTRYGDWERKGRCIDF